MGLNKRMYQLYMPSGHLGENFYKLALASTLRKGPGTTGLFASTEGFPPSFLFIPAVASGPLIPQV